MGLCWSSGPGSLNRQSPRPQSLPRNPEAKRQIIRIDESSPFLQSYSYLQKNVFEKKVYDWRSIPIITEFDPHQRAFFQVKNKGIKACNFVVGIIKKSAVRMGICTPWKTQYCICYQSHEQRGESGILYDGSIQRNGKGIEKGQSICIIVGMDCIQFRSNKSLIAKRLLPSGFLNDEILPYVALFNKGDLIQIVNELVFIDPKKAKQ